MLRFMDNRPRAFLLAAALALSACGGSGEGSFPAGPEQKESRSVEMDKSERVRAQVKMQSGELEVQGGANALLNADFTYNVAAWKPELQYRSSGGTGNLVLEQPGTGHSSGNSKNRWNLRFNDKVPLELKVEFGAGDAQLSLGSLNLRGLDFQIGAGKLRLDLRGTPAQDYSVHIQGGVGEATVYLPKQVGISASASGGIGGISVRGLTKSGDGYVNDAFATAKVKIRLEIQGGVGSINLIAE